MGMHEATGLLHKDVHGPREGGMVMVAVFCVFQWAPITILPPLGNGCSFSPKAVSSIFFRCPFERVNLCDKYASRVHIFEKA